VQAKRHHLSLEVPLKADQFKKGSKTAAAVAVPQLKSIKKAY
jgi:hypothetical protein